MLVSSTVLLYGQDNTRDTIQKINCKKDSTQQYAFYIPANYTPEKLAPLLIFLDPASRGDVPVGMYKSVADEYGVIIAGSFNSKNFDGLSSVQSFTAIYNDVVNQYNIDPARVWIAGFSGAARAAASIGMSYSEITAVIACGAGFAGDEEVTPANGRGTMF